MDTEHLDIASFDVISGTCMEMCPKAEILERQRLCLIHRLECVNFGDPQNERQRNRRMDISKMVKSYSRPAAGLDSARPELLRPYPVLLKTVTYLLKLVKENPIDFVHVYDFLFDRLRAVRQDMIIQRLPIDQTKNLLETMLPFYLYTSYLYKSSDKKLSSLDLVLHETQTKEIVSRLQEGYLLHYMTSLSSLSPLSRSLSDSCYFRFLPSIQLLDCLLSDSLCSWSKLLSDKGVVRKTPDDDRGECLIQEILFAKQCCNYVRFFRLFRKLNTYERLAASNYVSRIRLDAFKIISKAYCSRQQSSKIQMKILQEWLDYCSIEDVRLCCTDLKLDVIFLQFLSLLMIVLTCTYDKLADKLVTYLESVNCVY